METIGRSAKIASKTIARATAEQKNKILKAIAAAILEHEHEIIVENAKDV